MEIKVLRKPLGPLSVVPNHPTLQAGLPRKIREDRIRHQLRITDMWSKMRSKGSSLGIVNLKKSGSRNETKPSVNQRQVRIQKACLELNKK